MAKRQSKSGLIITIIALGLTLVIVGTIAFLQNLNRPTATDLPVSTETTETETPAETTTDEESTTEETTAPVVDPATLTSIDIEPMAITVFYTKGTPGFEFAVKRTADRTEYVEFSSPDLVGTKCTNDGGVFASIIKNPAASEDQTTLSQKVTVGSDIYGLSLAGENCTSNTDLLEEYQTAFTNGFSQLKVME
jgi:hypothetical protein